MQTPVSAPHPVGTAVGDIFSLRRPDHLVTVSVHFGDKIFLASRLPHGVLDHRHQLKLPALALACRTVLSCGQLRTVFFIRLQHREAVCGADLIAELAQLLQRTGMLAQLVPRLEADAVDDEMGMDMGRVAVGSDQHLVSRPGANGKLQRDGIGFFIRNVFLRREGLDVLIEVHAASFVIRLLGQHEFRKGIFTAAVDAGAIISSVGVGDLVLPTAVIHETFHGAGALLCLTDIRYRCHEASSVISFSI